MVPQMHMTIYGHDRTVNNIPVGIPHPSRQILSSGAAEFTWRQFNVTMAAKVYSPVSITLAMEISGNTVYSLNVDVPIKWKRVCPRQENREVPSGITPCPWVSLV